MFSILYEIIIEMDIAKYSQFFAVCQGMCEIALVFRADRGDAFRKVSLANGWTLCGLSPGSAVAGRKAGVRGLEGGTGEQHPRHLRCKWLAVHSPLLPRSQFTYSCSPVPSCRDIRVGQRPVTELARVLALEAQRLRVVALEQGDEERERQKVVRAQFK